MISEIKKNIGKALDEHNYIALSFYIFTINTIISSFCLIIFKTHLFGIMIIINVLGMCIMDFKNDIKNKKLLNGVK